MTSYARFDHGAWLAGNVKGPISPFGRRVAYIIGVTFGGIYNAPIPLSYIKWGDKNGIFVPLNPGHGLASWDFREMTTLTLLAHELAVRVSVQPLKIGYRYRTESEDTFIVWDMADREIDEEPVSVDEVGAALVLGFWQREHVSDAPMWQRHPTLDAAVTDFRAWFDETASALAGTVEREVAG